MPLPTSNDRFDETNRSMEEKKCKVIRQVYRAKKDWNLSEIQI